ncbi:hypothetical protein FRX31_006361 [Thalictrum thalictroides]|uniref:Uncharacterized protein n=1 Tax=Thalictrum thalictroides TaxID=46969 RepID=A0A7J6X5C8_THATH|nr:hypothetical protein FRX31_006361 [Thalictrum thalictroides]
MDMEIRKRRRLPMATGSLWRGIMANIAAVKEGISCRLGDGAKIHFWKDKWIGSEPLCSQFPEVWKELTVTKPSVFLSLFTVESLKEWLLAWPKKTGAELTIKVWRLLPYAVMWSLWKNRKREDL